MEKKYTSEHGPQRGALETALQRAIRRTAMRENGTWPVYMTEARARELAAGDRHYVARPDRVGDGWHVWDSVSDHRVEFQEKSNG